MRSTFSTRPRVLQALIILAISAAAVACTDNPIRPTAERALVGAGAANPPATTTAPTAVASAPRQSPVDLGRCLNGENDPSCFDARTFRASTVAVSPATAPGKVDLIGCSVSGSRVDFVWIDRAPLTASTFRLQAGSGPGLSNYADFMTLSTETRYSAFDVFPGTYYVRILAQDAAGQLGAASNEVVVVVGEGAGCTAYGTTPPPPPPPSSCAGPPRDLLVASQSAGAIFLTWNAPASGVPSSYKIVAGSSPGLSDLANFDTGNSALSYLAEGVPAGSYYVRAYSTSSCGLSGASNEVLVYAISFSSEVQVSVSWDSAADVDLHVVDPTGEEIYYGNTTSTSGGQLDVDSNSACGGDARQIENIRWSAGAPAGTYTVRVTYWSACGAAATNYLVTVRNGGSNQTFSGSFTGSGDRGGYGSGRLITTFTHAAALTVNSIRALIRPPQLSVPNPEKMRLSKSAR